VFGADRLIVGTSGSPGSLQALRYGEGLARAHNAVLIPVIAIPPPALAREFRHGRLARVFWRRSLTPERVLGDQGRRAV
jgi:hypothetical protein